MPIWWAGDEARTSCPSTLGVLMALTRSTGAFLVVGGPDGVGKTTLARLLVEEWGERGRYFHFIPSPLWQLEHGPPPDDKPMDKHRDSLRMLGILRLVRNLIRAWLSYLIAIAPAVRRGKVVIGDRWLYGYVAQPEALKFGGPAWLASLMLRLMPQPDVVMVLQAPPELILSRKSELTLAELTAEAARWADISPRAVFLDASRPAEELAGSISGPRRAQFTLRKYPPLREHVLIPERPRMAAVAGSSLYSPSRTRGLLGHRLGRGLLRAVGTWWLPIADPGEVPLDETRWEALIELLHGQDVQFEVIALHTRSTSTRTGVTLLALAGAKPLAFVRVGAKGELAMENEALRLLDRHRPDTFKHPGLLGTIQGESFDIAMHSVVLRGFHHPPREAPLIEIVAEIQSSLGDLPKPPGTPSHWVPMHGDFTPWNLREHHGTLSLVDWESVGWGPPYADQALYCAASEALKRPQHSAVWDGEASRFWINHLESTIPGRDDRLNAVMLASLRSRM